VEFICILIAAWQAKKTVWLPPDALPATCDSLASRVDVYIGEFPASYSPLTAELLLLQELTEYSDYALTVPGSAEIVVFTSGSTGEAQAIPKRVTQLLEEVGVLQALFGNIFAESIEIISTVSHQHIYGLLFKVFLPLYCARPIHAVSIHFPEELVSLSSKRPVVLLASPAHLKRFAESEVLRKSAITISAIFSSGGALPGDVSRQMALLANTVPIEIYGSSETGGIAWRQRNDTSDESWQPFPNVSWRIVDEENVIEVLSSHLYEASWFRMADQVKPAGDNRFLLQGRTDRIVKIEEKRVSLDAIERGLSKSSLVSSARAILVDMEDKTGRQRIAAFVVLSHKGREILASNGKLELMPCT
jgi:acyl-coenzyme A synthetase/AMP-(fatty) acid ligase